MTQQGTHTWDIIYQYHRCPSCGLILESREDYTFQEGQYQKTLTCQRCHHVFKAIKKGKVRKGFLMSQPEPIKFDWQD